MAYANSKTASELTAELKEAKQTIVELNKQLVEAEQAERAYKDALRGGKLLAATLEGFKDAGISEDRAWSLLLASIKAQGM